MALAIQIFGLLFGLFMVYYTFLKYKRNEFTVKESSFWIIFWVLFIVVTQKPEILDPFLTKWGFVRAMDFFVVIGFIFLIGALFYTYTIVRRNQKMLEEIVRKIAMKKK